MTVESTHVEVTYEVRPRTWFRQAALQQEAESATYALAVKIQRPSAFERWPQLGPAKWVPKMRVPESA